MEELKIVENENASFAIEDDSSADWAVRKILEEEAERDRLIKLAKEQIEVLKSKIVDLETRCDNNTAFLKTLLADYFTKVPHKKGATQESYNLLSGKLVMKAPYINYEYDEEKLTAYLQEEGLTEYLSVKVTPRWGELKKHLDVDFYGDVINKDTGELISVIEAYEEPASFQVK